jgi:hypothetical protein
MSLLVNGQIVASRVEMGNSPSSLETISSECRYGTIGQALCQILVEDAVRPAPMELMTLFKYVMGLPYFDYVKMRSVHKLGIANITSLKLLWSLIGTGAKVDLSNFSPVKQNLKLILADSRRPAPLEGVNAVDHTKSLVDTMFIEEVQRASPMKGGLAGGEPIASQIERGAIISQHRHDPYSPKTVGMSFEQAGYLIGVDPRDILGNAAQNEDGNLSNWDEFSYIDDDNMSSPIQRYAGGTVTDDASSFVVADLQPARRANKIKRPIAIAEDIPSMGEPQEVTLYEFVKGYYPDVVMREISIDEVVEPVFPNDGDKITHIQPFMIWCLCMPPNSGRTMLAIKRMFNGTQASCPDLSHLKYKGDTVNYAAYAHAYNRIFIHGVTNPGTLEEEFQNLELFSGTNFRSGPVNSQTASRIVKLINSLPILFDSLQTISAPNDSSFAAPASVRFGAYLSSERMLFFPSAVGHLVKNSQGGCDWEMGPDPAAPKIMMVI